MAKIKTPKLLLALTAIAFSFSALADENKNDPKDSLERISKDLDNLRAEISKITPATYPRVSRVFLDYAKSDGRISDNANDPITIRPPRASGDTDLDTTRIGLQLELTPKLSGSISASVSNGDSDISSDSVANAKTKSHSTSYNGSLSYLFTPWLSGGLFISGSNGHADTSTNTFGPTTTSKTGTHGFAQGISLNAAFPVGPKILVNLGPSYIRSEFKQKFSSDVDPNPPVSNRSIELVNLNASASYFFADPNIIVTVGASHHLIQHESRSPVNAPRDDWSSVYLRAAYVNSSKYEINFTVLDDFGDSTYANDRTYMLGIAKSF